MYLVDTNIISEARKGAMANVGVQAFWRAVPAEAVFIAVQTIGEIQCGLESIQRRGDTSQAKRLQTWLDRVLTDYGDRILDFDVDCARVWGKLISPTLQHPVDKQIAAIALIHDFTVVTRNTSDFRGCGVTLLNPFA